MSLQLIGAVRRNSKHKGLEFWLLQTLVDSFANGEGGIINCNPQSVAAVMRLEPEQVEHLLRNVVASGELQRYGDGYRLNLPLTEMSTPQNNNERPGYIYLRLFS